MRILLALGLLLGVAASAFPQGQFGTRSLHGTVTNASGDPIAGAVVKLKDLDSLMVRSYITDKDGTYVFHGLRDNSDYKVQAEYQGKKSGEKTLTRFNTSKDAVINLRLSS